MRTTPKNPGNDSAQDQKLSNRGRAPRPAGSPARKTSPSEFQSDRPRTGPTRPDAKPAYKGRSAESPRSSGPSRAGGKPFEKGERVAKPVARPMGAKPGFVSRTKSPAAAPAIKEMDFLSGRNPVMEALRSGRPISKIFISAGDHQGSIREIIALAKEKGIPVQTTEAAKLEAMSLGIRAQGVVAMVSPVAYASIEDMVAQAESRDEKPCLVLLDQLKDPQNLGAVLRTVDAAGAPGVLIPQRRSCQLSAAVAKASAGAIEYVKVAQIGNVAQTLDTLKKQGFWVIGADPERGVAFQDVDLTGPVVIVIGDEGEGMAHLTREKCDSLVRIPMRGKVQSLNASVASAILLYELLRQRGL